MKLTVQNLSKSFDNIAAVNHVNLTLESGIYGLLGKNGAGKTTLLKMLAQLIPPTKGRINYNGKEINGNNKKYRKILGYLPQDFGFYPEFTAEEYLHYIGLLKGLNKNEILSISDELLKSVDLYKVRKKKMQGFSGGMVRRVGIAQALLNNPKILILDEPTAGLDPQERIRFRNMIGELAHNRIIILSTHIVTDIELIANNIIMMEYGNVLKQGSVNQCLEEMKNKVWSYLVSKDEYSMLKTNGVVCGMKELNHQIKIRVISDKIPHKDAVAEQPVLEDLFAYYSGRERDKNVSV